MSAMREMFPEYCPLSDDEVFKMWGACLFIFDTNVLLNMYRYKAETVGQFFSVCANFADRLWMPYQVCKEFMRNRPAVVTEQDTIYEQYMSFISRMEDVVSGEHAKLKAKMHYCFDIEDVVSEFMEKLSMARERMGANKSNNSISPHDRLSNDNIMSKLEALYAGRIGQEPCDVDKKKIVIAERYKNGVPPGYADANSKTEEHSFGDCLIWFEILEKARQEKVSIVFVTDDKKEDWIWKVNGRRLWCRPELKKEFHEYTDGQLFHIYDTVRFLEIADSALKTQLEKSSFEDIARISQGQDERDIVWKFVDDVYYLITEKLIDVINKRDRKILVQHLEVLHAALSDSIFLNPTKVMTLLSPIRNMIRGLGKRGRANSLVIDDLDDEVFKLVIKYRNLAVHGFPLLSMEDNKE